MLLTANNFLLKKLDIISGVINTIEGIARRVKSDVVFICEQIIYVRDIVEKIHNNQQQIDKSSFHFSKIKIGNVIAEGRITKFTMNEFQFVEATFAAVKKNNQPAKVENPRAETDHPEMVTAEIINESTARFTAIEGSVSEPTAILCKVIADADLGEGVREIEVVGTLPLTPGEAESLNLTFGEAQDKT